MSVSELPRSVSGIAIARIELMLHVFSEIANPFGIETVCDV